MTAPGRLLVGERVRLNAIEPEDHATIAEWSNDPGYLRTMRTGMAAPDAREQSVAFHEKEAKDPNRYGFAIRLVDAPGIIGVAALKDIEWSNRSGWLAIGIGPAEQRGHGLGTEALGLLLHFAFHELNLRRVGLTVVRYNETAIKTYLGAGFVEEGIIREAVERDGARHDLLIYGLLAEEWGNGSGVP